MAESVYYWRLFQKQPIRKSFQRFDPEDPEHVAWMEVNKSNVINKKSKPFDAEAFNDVYYLYLFLKSNFTHSGN